MALTPLNPEPIVPRNPKPRPERPVLVTDEGKVANEIATLPASREMQQMVVAIAAKAAKDILLGNLPFKSAGEASKVARDFAAIAKDLTWDDERESLMAADSAEDRKDSLAAFRARAQKQLENGQ